MRKNIFYCSLACFIKWFSLNQLLNKELFLVVRNKYLTPCAEVAWCKKFVLDKLSVVTLKYKTSTTSSEPTITNLYLHVERSKYLNHISSVG